jgi:outer membrane immunogenic protein
MIRGFALAACLAAAAPGAFAADLPGGSKDWTPELQATWTGFYAGVSLGASINRSNMTGQGYDPISGGFASLEGYAPTNANSSNTSFMGSIEAGYNWQFNNYVVGAAVDISRLSSKHTSGTANNDVTATDIMSSNVDYLGTLRARLGYVVTSNMLVYGTGGLAVARYTGGYADSDYTPGDKSSDSQWGLGWVAGAGVDYRLTQNWFVRGEYLHVSTSANLSTFEITEVERYTQKSSLTQDMFKAGIFYQF